MPTATGAVLRELTPPDERQLRALLESDRRLNRTGRWRRALDSALDAGIRDGRPLLLGAWIDDELLAICDVRLDRPRPGNAHLAMLHVHADHRRMGLGRLVHLLVAVRVRDHGSIHSLSVNLAPGEGCEPFWRDLGYAPDGPRRPGTLRRSETWTRAL